MKWTRVTKSLPCPVCEKQDWCCVGDYYVCCMRVASDKPAGNGGWLHKRGKLKAQPPPAKEERILDIDPKKLLWDWLEKTKAEHVEAFAFDLGVTAASLRALDSAWAANYNAWAFPMKDGTGNIVGIRLRTLDGRKFAVTGSHQGIFCPVVKPSHTAYILEGPTDTAAAVSIGLFGIGRPSCVGCIDHVNVTLRRKGVTRAVVVSDNDGPGLGGSETLMLHLSMPSCRMVLPAKDMRAFVKQGGNSAMLDSILRNMVWTKPNGDTNGRMAAGLPSSAVPP